MFQPKVRRASITASRSNTGAFFQRRIAGLSRSADTSSKEPVAQEESCAGWESDPQSFCIRVAKHYLETEYKIEATAKTVNAADDGSCIVKFDDGTEVVVMREDPPKQEVHVVLWHPKKSLEPKHRCYAYKCPASGTLELTRLECKDSK
jgi:hypothetical protein